MAMRLLGDTLESGQTKHNCALGTSHLLLLVNAAFLACHVVGTAVPLGFHADLTRSIMFLFQLNFAKSRYAVGLNDRRIVF